ncbi:uncharacterized protein LOC103313784 isoform X2 [Tribolium castaneum]|uniref:uncharacterized protein LOC103313784 isoform X2 n=1 Tax=Tribolium castaneum TaxID=7070 RepID=UPI0030FE1902
MGTTVGVATVLFLFAIWTTGILSSENLEKTPLESKHNIQRRAPLDDYSYLRNPRSGMVLEASGRWVIIVQPSGASSQLWIPEHLANGKFFIVNKGNGNVLDVDGDGLVRTYLTTNPKRDDDIKQTWLFGYDNTIANARAGLVLDIPIENNSLSSYKPGMLVTAHPHHGEHWQQFVFQKPAKKY